MLAKPPYEFSIHIPSDINPGKYGITADGTVARGERVHSERVLIDVELSRQPTMIETDPTGPFDLNVGDLFMLAIIGTYRGGSKVDLSNSTQTRYISEDARVVAVGSDGSIKAVGAGSSQVIIRVGQRTITIKSTVKSRH